MAEFEGSPRGYWEAAVEHALSGSLEEARRLVQVAQTIDRGGEVTAEERSLVECLLALRIRDAPAARAAAQRTARSERGQQLLRQAMANGESRFPHGSERIVREALGEGQVAASGAPRQRHPTAISIVAITVLVALIAGGLFAARWAVNRSDKGSYDRFKRNVGLVVVQVRAELGPLSPQWIPVSTGTAFAIGRDGLLLTNRHVIDVGPDVVEANQAATAWNLSVVFPDDAVAANEPADGSHDGAVDSASGATDVVPGLRARIRHRSAYLDLALLQVDRTFTRPLRFTAKFEPGQSVLAFGYPGPPRELAERLSPEAGRERLQAAMEAVDRGDQLALGHWLSGEAFVLSVVQGVISAVRETEHGTMAQTDAAVYAGNSGGPLVNEQNEVVGVVTLKHAEAAGVTMAITIPSVWEDLGHVRGIRWPADISKSVR